MLLGTTLIERGLVTSADIDAAIERQQVQGGRLGDNLIALGCLTAEQLAAVINSKPPVPATLAEIGISPRNLLNLMLKFIHLQACETVQDLAERVMLPHRIVEQLLEDAAQEKLIQRLGAVAGATVFAVRYGLTEMGRGAVREALEQNLYLGPAPISLAAYQDRIGMQRIANERLDADALSNGFKGLVVPAHYLRRLLPAVNSGRSVLLFGPPGNGKTTLATRIATIFKDVVYIPYAVEVAGQIIKIFDPGLHKPVVSAEPAAAVSIRIGAARRETFDQRWVACSRPVAVAGGDLTLDMLDLQHNSDGKFYDAPLHVKALNGMLLIDDFGRQNFSPDALLNRWIVPMENHIDYLKLDTGVRFSLPFDMLLMFSTNLQPADLMDAAFLRRIQYKVKLFAPTRDEYLTIFTGVAKSRGLEMTDEVFDFVIERLTRNTKLGLAYYQPVFICDHVIETCKCFNLRPQVTKELVSEALANLYLDIEDAQGEDPMAEGPQQALNGVVPMLPPSNKSGRSL